MSRGKDRWGTSPVPGSHRAGPAQMPAGFTLIELLVALALTGIVVLLAHSVMSEVAEAALRGQVVVRELDRAGNRRLWLIRVFANITTGSAPNMRFEGRDGWNGSREADRVSVVTRVGGEPAHAATALEFWLAGDTLLAELVSVGGSDHGRADTLVVATGVSGFGADYLTAYGATSRWVGDWVSTVTAPLAVRLRLDWEQGEADTLLLHVGRRG